MQRSKACSNRLVCLAALLLLLSGAAEAPEEGAETIAYFFHNNACESCSEIDRLYEIIAQSGIAETANLRIVEYKPFSHDLRETLEGVERWFGSVPSYPFLIVGNDILCGYDEIAAELCKSVVSATSLGERAFSPASAAALRTPAPRRWPLAILIACVLATFLLAARKKK